MEVLGPALFLLAMVAFPVVFLLIVVGGVAMVGFTAYSAVGASRRQAQAREAGRAAFAETAAEWGWTPTEQGFCGPWEGRTAEIRFSYGASSGHIRRHARSWVYVRTHANARSELGFVALGPFAQSRMTHEMRQDMHAVLQGIPAKPQTGDAAFDSAITLRGRGDAGEAVRALVDAPLREALLDAIPLLDAQGCPLILTDGFVHHEVDEPGLPVDRVQAILDLQARVLDAYEAAVARAATPPDASPG